MHFSSPSGQRFSWCLPWNRGAVGRFSSGYWTVSTFRNICRKVTPNPFTGLRNSSTGDLLDSCARNGTTGIGLPATGAGGHANAAVVRQIQGRDGEARAGGIRPVRRGGRPGSRLGGLGRGGAPPFRGHIAR